MQASMFAGLRTFVSADIKGENNEFLGTDISHFISLCFITCHKLCFSQIWGKTFYQQKGYSWLYCDTRFIVVVWNRTHNTFKLYLYRVVQSTDRQNETKRCFIPFWPPLLTEGMCFLPWNCLELQIVMPYWTLQISGRQWNKYCSMTILH